MNNIKYRSFSSLEILITVSLLVVIVTGFFYAFNPKTQIDKAKDGQRKSDLAQLSKAIEDWYNDKSCYPKPSEICYDPVDGETDCNICGNESGSPDFSPYLTSLPCDPAHPTKKIYYLVDELSCPKTYWIYTNLANTKDPIITSLGCQNGCGPFGTCDYNYGITSSNTAVEYCTDFEPNPTPSPTPITGGLCSTYNPVYIVNDNGICNVCGSYQQCLANYPNETLYGNSNCSMTCTKD